MSDKEKQTEKRMYVLVPYNISEIQKGIQSAHAVTEYSDSARRSVDEYRKQKKKLDSYSYNYLDWITNWKTIIVLNGGTTNDNKESKWYGSLQQHRDKLQKLNIIISEFHEPDLNNALTAVAFIVDMEKDWMVLKYLQDMKLA